MTKIYSWNVNGIRAVLKKDLFYSFVAKHKPEILCIQETKAQPEQIEIDLPGYKSVINSADRKGYSGTAIYSKLPILSSQDGFSSMINKKYKLEDSYGDTTAEGRVITTEFEDFYLVTVYTPNAKDDLSRVPMREQWDPAFLEHCQEFEASKPVVFCGDLNVAHMEDDLARPKENDGKKGCTKEERSGFASFLDAGYVDTFRIFTKGNGHYSWWTAWGGARDRNVGWRIDYVMASEDIVRRVKSAKIHADVMGSDHCPVSVELDLKNG